MEAGWISTNQCTVALHCREDGISDPVRYPERERRFLGCLRVPLSAVYQAQVLQGTLRLEVSESDAHPGSVRGVSQWSAQSMMD
jgi:hypothetical protein